jgi:hypothetical protein
MKRPIPKTFDEQMRDLVGKDCFVEPPSEKSWIVVGVVWGIAILMCWIAILFG